MARTIEEIEAEVKAFILSELLSEEVPDALESSTPLISAGHLDSLSTLTLVDFLEEEYGVEFEAHEISVDYLDSISQIAEFIAARSAGS